MLSKLRNRLVLLIMTMTSIILTVAFIAIYITAYTSTNADNKEKLDRAEEVNISSNGQLTVGGGKADVIVLNRLIPDRGIYFNLLVDSEGNLLIVDSAVQLRVEVYAQAAALAWKNNDGKPVSLEGRLWKYLVAPASINVVTDGKTQIGDDDETYQIRFLDVTDSQQNLYKLMMTLLLVGSALLVTFFFLSCYFANRAMMPMAEAWEKQRQFVADASHELKTPLSIINANISALYANKEETIESQLKWLDYISAGTTRMSNLINQLLSLAKIEDASIQPDKSELNISEVLDQAIISQKAAVQLKEIKVAANIAPDIITITDSVLVGQIINILMDNAIKYTEQGGWITIALAKERACAVLTIKNSGKGISKQDLPKVFDRFYRADASRSQSRSSYGLGLSIAKASIDKLGGTIEAESIESKLTVFTVKIPL